MIRYSILPLLIFGLSGCASTLNIGGSEYSCRGYPEGTRCISAREIYKRTHDKDHLSSYSEEGKETDPGLDNNSASISVDAASEPGVSQKQQRPVAIPRLEKPLPIRSNAKVMRIFIAPWVDKDGDLHSPGYVFTEVEPRRWTIGADYQPADVALTPLQVLTDEEVLVDEKRKPKN